jgi:hypothetical protein
MPTDDQFEAIRHGRFRCAHDQPGAHAVAERPRSGIGHCRRRFAGGDDHVLRRSPKASRYIGASYDVGASRAIGVLRDLRASRDIRVSRVLFVTHDVPVARGFSRAISVISQRTLDEWPGGSRSDTRPDKRQEIVSKIRK